VSENFIVKFFQKKKERGREATYHANKTAVTQKAK